MSLRALKINTVIMGRRRDRRRAITLIECVIALTILPLAVSAIAYSVVSGQMDAAEALRQERGAALAEALMEEILALPYNDPQGSTALGPDSGETSRSLYDNMDDFNGFSESAGSLKNASGTLYPTQYQKFSRSVTCAYTTQTLLGDVASGLQITVTVSDKKGKVVTLIRFVPVPS